MMTYKQRIEKKTADLYADLFSRTSIKGFFQKAQSYMSRIKIEKDWFMGKRCLDAGCGSGMASYGLSTINKTEVFAFDISWSCLEIARKMLRMQNNFLPVQSSVEIIPFKDNSFDFINCNGVLHHIFDTDTALSEFFRILKPGGLLFIGVYGRGGLMNEYKIRLYRFFSKQIPHPLLRKLLWARDKNEWLDNLCVPIRKAFSEQEIRNKLSRSGFSEIRRVSQDFYRTSSNSWEKLIVGPDGMYLHFLAKKEWAPCTHAFSKGY